MISARTFPIPAVQLLLDGLLRVIDVRDEPDPQRPAVLVLHLNACGDLRIDRGKVQRKAVVRHRDGVVGLFTALTYWNDWFQGSLYMRAPTMREMANVPMSANSGALMAQESLKMATALIVTGPILLVYPFIQKYFVTGPTIGAAKG